MTESSRVENTVGKEKLLVTSNFSFSHSVFKRLIMQTREKQGLFGKGLTNKSADKLTIYMNKMTYRRDQT